MPTVLTTLTANLDRDLRRTILSRVDAMQREFAYLAESKNRLLVEIRRRGWNMERLSTVAALNAFYQIVLGPLASSARDRSGVLGREVPILYGELIRFDAERSARLNAAHLDFVEVIARLPARMDPITASRASDIVFYIHRELTRGDEF